MAYTMYAAPSTFIMSKLLELFPGFSAKKFQISLYFPCASWCSGSNSKHSIKPTVTSNLIFQMHEHWVKMDIVFSTLYNTRAATSRGCLISDLAYKLCWPGNYSVVLQGKAMEKRVEAIPVLRFSGYGLPAHGNVNNASNGSQQAPWFTNAASSGFSSSTATPHPRPQLPLDLQKNGVHNNATSRAYFSYRS